MAVAADFHAVTPSLFAWEAYEPAVKCELSSCALDTDDGLIFIDPIDLADAALERLLHGRNPAAIILTNGNHTRAAAMLRDSLSVKVLASRDATGLDISDASDLECWYIWLSMRDSAPVILKW